MSWGDNDRLIWHGHKILLYGVSILLLLLPQLLILFLGVNNHFLLLSLSLARDSSLMVIVVHLDFDLVSSFAARREPFLLFGATAFLANEGTDADTVGTNAGSTSAGSADPARVFRADGGIVGISDASEVDEVVDPVDSVDGVDSPELYSPDLGDMMILPGGPLVVVAGSACGSSLPTVCIDDCTNVPPSAGTGTAEADKSVFKAEGALCVGGGPCAAG